jgi:hypothetical protein
VTTTDGHPSPGKLRQVKNEWFLLTPEGALMAALDASDLQSDPDEKLGSAPVHVVRFHWNGIPTRIFLNAYSGFLSASEILFADPTALAMRPGAIFVSGWPTPFGNSSPAVCTIP